MIVPPSIPLLLHLLLQVAENLRLHGKHFLPYLGRWGGGGRSLPPEPLASPKPPGLRRVPVICRS